MSTVLVRPQVSVAELVEALRAQQHHRPAVQGSVGEPPKRNVALHERARTLLVVGAQPGAGATVVSVAVADAIATFQAEPFTENVVLLDAAAREVSGMAAASVCEVGGRSDGWRRGRRGPITVLRAAASPAAPLDLPDLPTGPGWLIVDGGWPWREVVADPSPIQTLVGCAQLVVVCRASVPGVGHAESALCALPGAPLVAAVGARRWPPAAKASFGPRLAQAVSEGRALLIPSDPRVAVNGVDGEAFPGGIAAAAQRLVALLLEPPVSGSTAHPRRRGFRR